MIPIKTKFSLTILVLFIILIFTYGYTTTFQTDDGLYTSDNLDDGSRQGIQTETCSRNTIHGEVLASYIPDVITGWVSDNVMWESVSTGEGCDYSIASQIYYNQEYENIELEINIYDSNNLSILSWLAVDSEYEECSGFCELIEINGYPAYKIEYYNAFDYIFITLIIDMENGIYVFGEIIGRSDYRLMLPYMESIDYEGLKNLV